MNTKTHVATKSPSESCYLYMLTHDDGSVFKIGVANDIVARATVFSQEVDYAKSWAARGTRAACYRAEGVLHRLLHRFRRRLDGDGGTEWFSIDCYDRARVLFDALRDDIGIGSLETISPPNATVGQSDYLRLSRVERAYRREARRREKIEAQYQENVRRVAMLERAAATILERAQIRRYRGTLTGGSVYVRGTKETLDATNTLFEHGGFTHKCGALNIFGRLRIRKQRDEHALGFASLNVIWHHIDMQDAIFSADIRDRIVGVLETLFLEPIGHLLPVVTT
ncbi:GIY-YIG nuclease family protein [Burkholderia stagnalis]|uniref:GIY-YIG nuclease family protein n=1 Tax=Burkholderia stagnalis TaxID=1503054 RepID=UPI000A535A3F|nr:GIY-YIG nuclease family protein [Burkholderia stagnalis]